MITEILTTANLTAQGAEQGQEGGPDIMMIVLLVGLGLMIFMMMRSRKKQQRQVLEQRESMEPGMEVMTGSGIFGTIRHVNREENKVLLEVAPGVTMTVHIQAIVPQSQIPGGAPSGSTSAQETSTGTALNGEVQEPTENSNPSEYGTPDDYSADQDNQDKK